MPITAIRRARSPRGAPPFASTPASDTRSVEAVIAPQLHQVPVEVLAHGFDLSPEARAQLSHQLLVRRRGPGEDQLALDRVEGGPARCRRRDRLDASLDRSGDGPAADADRVHELVEQLRARTHGR